MAGIGFELRKLLRKETLVGLLQAYTLAGIIGSGPWVLSIVGILAIGLLGNALTGPSHQITQFQTSVTYLIASSLILTGGLQLAFTRFVSDRLFERQNELVMPNLVGILTAVALLASGVATIAVFVLFPDESVLYRILMLSSFALLCTIWIVTIFLSGMKRYKEIVGLFALGYGITVMLALLLRRFGLEGLLTGFFLGHCVLLWGMLALTAYDFRPQRLIAFDFARPEMRYPSLLAIGTFYNLGIWADKFMFWLFPDTSEPVVGLLRASIIYDLPVFLAYLSIIPGMAVFMVRIETDFVEYYDKFYDAVRSGGSLEYIEDMRDEMLYSIRQGLAEIGKIQTLAVLITFVAGPSLLELLGISELYLPLLHLQVIGAGLQVVLLSVLNVFFYLDQRRIILVLCLEFLVLNVILTGFSLWKGAAFYGYGFTVSVLITLCTGLALLDRKLNRLEYETFMLQ